MRESVSPPKSRMQRKFERRRLLLKKFLILTVIAASFVGVTFYIWTHDVNLPFIGSSRELIEKITKTETPIKKRATFLMVGTEKNGQEIKSDNLLLMVFDSERKKIDGILIPKDTMVTIPGRGHDKIYQSLSGENSVLIDTVRNFVGVEVDYLIKLSGANFKKVQEFVVSEAFKKPYETTLSFDEFKAYGKAISEIDEKNIRFVYLPVKPIIIGNETFLEPKLDEMEKVVSELWRTEVSVANTTKVLVLNGCGVPLIGVEAAQKLINASLRVMDIKNADNFNYETTQIIYCRKSIEAAEKAKEVLKVGEVKSGEISQDYVDLIIIIGKDFELAWD